MNEQETVADIIAEKRSEAKELRDTAKGVFWNRGELESRADDLEDEADRLEAAHRRERRLLMSCARWILCHDIYGHIAKELLAECKEVLNDDGQFLFKEDEQ